MAATEIVVRPLASVEEYSWLEPLQKRVWGFVDADTVPLHVLVAVGHNGGTTLGAFDPDRRGADGLVGMTFGFDGHDELGPKHHSHQLGVDPRMRGLGLGARLKWAQRQKVLEQARSRVTWTFDPLMASNAWFNIRTLGGVACRYIVDVYGQIRDELNRGLPTDRLIVDWWIDDAHVEARADRRRRPEPRAVEGIPDVLVTRHSDDSPHRHVDGWRLPEANEVRLELPPDLLRLKADDPELARAWRHASREALLHLFAHDYVVTDVRRLDDRPYYVLECGRSQRTVRANERGAARLVHADGVAFEGATEVRPPTDRSASLPHP